MTDNNLLQVELTVSMKEGRGSRMMDIMRLLIVR